MKNYLDYLGLAVLVVGFAVIILRFGRQFVREFKSLWG